MSVEAIALCLHHSQAKGVDKLVLIGIANHEGDGGAYPAIATLELYSGVSRTRVKQALRTLQDLGEIVIHVQKGGSADCRPDRRPNRYDVLVRCPSDCDGTTKHKTRTAGRGVPADSSRESETETTGGTLLPNGGQAYDHEPPLLEPPLLEPPITHAKARDELTARDIVAAYVDKHQEIHNEKPLSRALGRIAREARQLLDEGRRFELVIQAAEKCAEEGHANIGAAYLWVLAEPQRQTARVTVQTESTAASYARLAARFGVQSLELEA